MSKRKDDGGPAFSRPYGGHPDPAIGDPEMQSQEGMTLRDYFAAKAMQSLLADEEFYKSITPPGLAEAAYVMADKMIAERAK